MPFAGRTRYRCSSILSVAEIINELPKLSGAELRTVREKLLELGAQDEGIELCNQAALEGAIFLDRLEEEDAGREPT